MAKKEQITISSLKEGEIKILSKQNNSYHIGNLEDNIELLSEVKAKKQTENLGQEYVDSFIQSYESSAYKQGGLKNYREAISNQQSDYYTNFSKADLETIMKLSENCQYDLYKTQQLNNIISYYVNIDDLIGRVIETVENNTNKSYSIKKKASTTNKVFDLCKDFCEQIDIGNIISEGVGTAFLEGTFICYLLGNPKDGWHVAYYPLGVCEITDISIDHEPVVAFNVHKLVERVRKSITKYFTNSQFKEMFEERIGEEIKNYYPEEVYEGYLNNEHYVPLNNERCGVVRVNRNKGLYGCSPIVKGLRSEIMLETVDAVDRKNLIDRAKKIYLQTMRKECLDENNNSMPSIPAAAGFLQAQLSSAMQQEDVIYTAPPYAEDVKILEPKVELTPTEKIAEYRNRLLNALGISFVSSEDGSSYTVTNLNYAELLKTINKIARQLEPILNKYLKLLCFETGRSLKNCPTIEIESTELISMESKVSLINTYYTTLGLSRETVFKILDIDIEVETQRRKQENDKGLDKIFKPYATSYNSSGDELEEGTETEDTNKNGSEKNDNEDKRQKDVERNQEENKQMT